MNNKKKMVLGAAFVVAIMALAGVGYAAVSFNQYEGKTSSVTDTYDVDYVVAKLNKEAYSDKADLYITFNSDTTGWDDVNDEAITEYTWTGSSIVKHALTIVVPETDSPTDTYKLKITVGALSLTGYTLYYKAASVSEDYVDDLDGWTPYSAAIDNVTVAAGTTYNYCWVIAPTDPENAEPDNSNTLTLPAIEYLVTAEQGVATP